MCSSSERRIFLIERRLLPLFAAFALSGCAASQSVGGAPSVIPPGALNHRASAGVTWMSPEAKRSDLLYVSDTGTNAVYVYSYPKGTLLGTLSGFDTPWGLCSDKAGDVFIADVWNYRVVEYAHGGTDPIASLHYKRGHPMNCSVDPASGDLAVTYYFLNNPRRSDELAIYAGAKGSPSVRKGSKIHNGLWACTYDDRGNLFVDGTYGTISTNVGLAELPKGAKRLTDISLDTHIQYLSGVQWTGKHLAMADQGSGSDPATIYQFAINGTAAREVGATDLIGTKNVEQFWVQGHRVVAPSEDGASVLLYDYPKGGIATKTIDGLNTPFGGTVSRALR